MKNFQRVSSALLVLAFATLASPAPAATSWLPCRLLLAADPDRSPPPVLSWPVPIPEAVFDEPLSLTLGIGASGLLVVYVAPSLFRALQDARGAVDLSGMIEMLAAEPDAYADHLGVGRPRLAAWIGELKRDLAPLLP